MARGWYISNFRPNRAGQRFVLQAPGGNVGRFITANGARVLFSAQVLAPFASGDLKGSHTVKYSYKPREVTATITANMPYAMWVHEGTGIYGPSGQPIRANGDGFMYFRYQGRSWRLSSVRGQRPQPWLWHALEAGVDRSFITNRT